MNLPTKTKKIQKTNKIQKKPTKTIKTFLVPNLTARCKYRSLKVHYTFDFDVICFDILFVTANKYRKQQNTPRSAFPRNFIVKLFLF